MLHKIHNYKDIATYLSLCMWLVRWYIPQNAAKLPLLMNI